MHRTGGPFLFTIATTISPYFPMKTAQDVFPLFFLPVISFLDLTAKQLTLKLSEISFNASLSTMVSLFLFAPPISAQNFVLIQIFQENHYFKQ